MRINDFTSMPWEKYNPKKLMKRKLKFLDPFHCDVLIFDTIGSSWIEECIPPKCSFRNIDIRDRLPFLLSFGFCFRLIRNFFRLKKDIPYYRSMLWLSCLFEEINPKIIFTCADNNLPVSQYALDHPLVQVIFLQNALRDTIGSMPNGTYLPTYLSLGCIEAEIFKSIGVRYRSYLPVGSVKLGLALAKHLESDNRSFDICFISHYRPELLSNESSDLIRRVEKSHRCLFTNLMTYASVRDLTVVVASKTRETDLQDTEYEYFSSLAKGTHFEFIRGDKNTNEFATYLVALSSSLIVHPASTLGFEMFAAGKKVLFGASQQSDLIYRWGINHYFDALPKFVKLSSSSEQEFVECCDYIRQMPNSDYQNITVKSARKIVAMPEHEYPHEMVRRLLTEYLAR